jgi:hypothetical protein
VVISDQPYHFNLICFICVSLITCLGPLYGGGVYKSQTVILLNFKRVRRHFFIEALGTFHERNKQDKSSGDLSEHQLFEMGCYE